MRDRAPSAKDLLGRLIKPRRVNIHEGTLRSTANHEITRPFLTMIELLPLAAARDHDYARTPSLL